MKILGQPSWVLKGANTGISRFYSLLNGVDAYYLLENSIEVDRVVMSVFPESGGNAGLPSGAPVVTNGVWQNLDFTHAGFLQEIGKNGVSYFHGYIANIQLWNGGELVFSHPLNTDLLSAQLPNTIPDPEA